MTVFLEDLLRSAPRSGAVGGESTCHLFAAMLTSEALS